MTFLRVDGGCPGCHLAPVPEGKADGRITGNSSQVPRGPDNRGLATRLSRAHEVFLSQGELPTYPSTEHMQGHPSCSTWSATWPARPICGTKPDIARYGESVSIKLRWLWTYYAHGKYTRPVAGRSVSGMFCWGGAALAVAEAVGQRSYIWNVAPPAVKWVRQAAGGSVGGVDLSCGGGWLRAELFL